MKKTKIIIPALAVLLLSTAASVSGTVAWFSMNSAVKVDGMQVSTKVSSNLLIAETNLEANYTDEIHQSRVGVLEPASTIDARNFFYTTNAKGDGSAVAPASGTKYKAYSEALIEDDDDPRTEATEANWTNALDNAATAGKSTFDANFNAAYGFGAATTADVCYAYIDYSFYIKATSVADNSVLYMSKCNLLYNTAASGTPVWAAVGSKDFAWRVGLLATSAQVNTPANDANARVKTILGLDTTNGKALNQNQVNLVPNVVAGTTDITGKYTNPYGKGAAAASGTAVAGTKYYTAPSATANAVSSTSETAALVKIDENNEKASCQDAKAQANDDIDAGQTEITRVIVRLWLEGEDFSCTNETYAELTHNWKLDLEFRLGTSTDGVTTIGSVA